MSSFSNPELSLAWDFVESTGLNIFLTGKAGTGKTTFLKDLKRKSPKRMVVVAPTGVAAINAGGVTIHSFFQLPFSPFIPETGNNASFQSKEKNIQTLNIRKFNKEKLQIIKSLDLLVIDEISMVRADLLDSIDEVLRIFRNKDKPFGGVQLLMIGDLQQLAPVVKAEEWDILKNYYDSLFFFSSYALQKTHFISIELKHIFRQSDKTFIELLNKVRENKLDAATLEKINERFIPDFFPDDEEGYIILTTHNAKAKEINEARLNDLPGDPIVYVAEVEGDFPEYAFPTDSELSLKPGAQVMFVRNDSSMEKLYFNGKIGIVADIDDDVIFVECPEDDFPIEVSPVQWSNIKYSLDEKTKEIKEEVTGTFIQYPLKTAWAITIHKSQGLTFEKAIIDARNVFAHGQIYVALSRCRTLEGLVLSTPLHNPGIISNSAVSEFTSMVGQNPPGSDLLNKSKLAYFQALLLELFDFSEMRKQMDKFLRIIKENQHVYIRNPYNHIESFNVSIVKNIYDVAERFRLQLKQLFHEYQDKYENNTIIHERVIKGINYFIDKLENGMVSTITDEIFETDNKALEKITKEAVNDLLEKILYKLYCLQAGQNRFDVKSYLETRAKATLEIPSLVKKRLKAKKSEVLQSIKYPSLYNTLKLWRNQMSKETKLPAYMILHSKVMADLTDSLPSNKAELLKIKGIGKKKAEKFADDILEIISQFCIQNNIERDTVIISSVVKTKNER